jgi:hypothetical protein
MTQLCDTLLVVDAQQLPDASQSRDCLNIGINMPGREHQSKWHRMQYSQ